MSHTVLQDVAKKSSGHMAPLPRCTHGDFTAPSAWGGHSSLIGLTCCRMSHLSPTPPPPPSRAPPLNHTYLS